MKVSASYYRNVVCCLVLASLMLFAASLQAQVVTTIPSDPGPRPAGNATGCPNPGAKFPSTPCSDNIQPADAFGNDGAGNVVANGGTLTPFWFQALSVFGTTASVNGTDNAGNANRFIKGLGPSFNGESCLQCHSQPSIGGSSPTVNPQFTTAANDRGAINSIPSFITRTGPIREARFISAVPADGNAAAVAAGS